MKLLLDENLSPRILPEIEQIYPGSIHVRDRRLQRSTNREVWEFVKKEGYAIVSKDADFHQRSLFFGHPPKVI